VASPSPLGGGADRTDPHRGALRDLRNAADGSALIYLTADEVAALLEPDALLEALAHAFRALSAGEADVPARIAARSSRGMLAAMPGFLPEAGLGVKLVSVFAGNHGGPVPSHQGLIALFDGASGIPLAVLDCRVITARRTAAASALSVRECASAQTKILAIIGAGVQGRSHLEFVPRMRDFTEIRIASRNLSHAQRLAGVLPHAHAAPSFAEAARGADVICCCTDSPEPVLRREWVRPGTHITSVGFSATGSELEPELVRSARLIVETRAMFQPPPAGAAELVGLDPATAVELGEVLGGAVGRRNQTEITLYKSAGHAVQDLAAARLVYERALATGAGTRLPL